MSLAYLDEIRSFTVLGESAVVQSFKRVNVNNSTVVQSFRALRESQTIKPNVYGGLVRSFSRSPLIGELCSVNDRPISVVGGLSLNAVSSEPGELK